MDVENQVVEYLMKNVDMVVPESAVNRQLEHLLEDTKQRLKAQGLKEEDIKKREDEMRGELRKSAERDIKIYFILGKIAELENIAVEKGENLFHKVIGFLLKEANWS
jgi:trigger factor